jgi:hypothetical protein
VPLSVEELRYYEQQEFSQVLVLVSSVAKMYEAGGSSFVNVRMALFPISNFFILLLWLGASVHRRQLPCIVFLRCAYARSDTSLFLVCAYTHANVFLFSRVCIYAR